MAEGTEADAYLGENGAFQDGWLDNMPEGTFEKDDTGKFKQSDLAEIPNFPTLIKNHLNLQGKLGTAIQPLPEKATDDQKKAYRAKVGCPDTVEGYEVAKPALPEGMAFDDELIKSVTQFAHDNHIPKSVFEGLAKMVIERQITTTKQMFEAGAKAQAETEAGAQKVKDQAIETAENQLKTKYGAKYEEVREGAARWRDRTGDDELNKALCDLLAEKELDSHPVIIEAFYHNWKTYLRDSEIPAGTAGAGGSGAPGQLDYSKVVGNSGR